MKNVILSTLLRLLVTTAWCQPSPEVDLINQLNKFFGFDHNIFLLDESVQDRNRYIPINPTSNNHITPLTVYTFGYNNNLHVTTNTRWKQLKTLTTKTGHNKFLIVVAAEFNPDSTNNATQILDEVLLIQQVQKKVKIGIFFEKTISSMDIVLQLFRWSWSNRIVNIFCAFYLSPTDDAQSSLFTVFRFDPFDAKFLINMTGSDLLQNYFYVENKFPNYHHHPVQFFKFQRHIISDFATSYWRTVTHIFNSSISINIVPEESFIDGVLDKINEDAGMFRMSVNKSPNEIVLYPEEIQWLQLMIPHAQPYASIVGYLQNTTWIVLFGCVVSVIATASLSLTVSGYLQNNKRNSLVKCVVDVVNLLMNDNLAIKYGQLRRADIFIVVPLTFTGLIMANGILSVFKSYLTVPIYQRQIKTVDELYKSHIPIVSEKVFWSNDTIELLEGLTGLYWTEKVHPITRAAYDNGLEQLNSSVAYAALSSEVRRCLLMQKRFNVKAFYSITDPTLVQLYSTFPVKPEYPFLEQLQVIHHRLWNHGILKKWRTDTDEKEVSRLTKAKSVGQLNSNSGSDSNSFGGMITIIWCGWIMGGIAFICEIAWNRIRAT